MKANLIVAALILSVVSVHKTISTTLKNGIMLLLLQSLFYRGLVRHPSTRR